MSSSIPDRVSFLSSLAQELRSQSDRVRSLIGNRHWLSDGQHKESLLRDIIERHVPTGILVSHGFVVSPSHRDRISREQDILLLDSLVAMPILSQWGLSIAIPSLLLGSIAVKSRFDFEKLKDAIDCLASVLGSFNKYEAEPTPFLGAFFFNEDRLSDAVRLKTANYLATMGTSFGGVTADGLPPFPIVSCQSGEFFRTYKPLPSESDSQTEVLAQAFDCGELSSAVFLAHILDYLALRRGRRNAPLSSLIPDHFPIIASSSTSSPSC